MKRLMTVAALAALLTAAGSVAQSSPARAWGWGYGYGSYGYGGCGWRYAGCCPGYGYRPYYPRYYGYYGYRPAFVGYYRPFWGPRRWWW